MIYLTLTTRNRFWNFALTALCLANAERLAGAQLHIIDDATDDGSARDKALIVEALSTRFDLHFDRRSESQGYNAHFATFMQNLLTDPRSDLWLHLDDDLAFAPDVLVRAVDDYRTYLARGLLYVFVNCWMKAGRYCNGPLWAVRDGGGAAFVASRRTIESIGNIFADEATRAGPHRVLWERLRTAGEVLAINRDAPYAIQHTANEESLIFGRQPQWRDAWSRDLQSGRLIEIRPLDLTALRSAVEGGQLETYVRAANADLPVAIPLPAPSPASS